MATPADTNIRKARERLPRRNAALHRQDDCKARPPTKARGPFPESSRLVHLSPAKMRATQAQMTVWEEISRNVRRHSTTRTSDPATLLGATR